MASRRGVVTSPVTIGGVEFGPRLYNPKTDEDMGDPDEGSPLRREVLHALFAEAGAGEGDEVRITVTKTGRRPFGNRRLKYVLRADRSGGEYVRTED